MNLLAEQKQHLANLLTAIKRCIYFLEKSSAKHNWPLSASFLEDNAQNLELFESLSSINERFAKLQDILASAMRHSLVLAGEKNDNFLQVLAFFKKQGVIKSIEQWQLCRGIRNLTTHDYETNYAQIASHFNELQVLIKPLIIDANQFGEYCKGLNTVFDDDKMDVFHG